MRQELSREEAATFAAAPKSIEVAYPLGSFEAIFSNPAPQHESIKQKTSKKRKEDDGGEGRSSMPGPSSKRKKIFTPHDSKKL